METFDYLTMMNNTVVIQGEDEPAVPYQNNNNIAMPVEEQVHIILSKQMNNEEYNARAYYQFYVLLEQSGYKCAKLWHSYYEEELEHAKMIKDFLKDLNVKNILLLPIQFDGNAFMFNSLSDVISYTYELENKNLENLKMAYDSIAALGDSHCVKTSLLFLTKMIQEQCEEIHKALLLMNYKERTNDILQLDEFLSSLF